MQKRIWATAFLFGIVTPGLLAGFLYWYYLLPYGNDHRTVEYIIAPKSSLHEVAAFLKNQHVIRSDKGLIAWMRIKKMEKKIQSGLVVFECGDGILKASHRLLTAKQIELSIMIPEGLTIEQTAGHIARSIPIDTVKFIAYCYDSAFIASCDIPATSLEGYLYPDTYRLPDKVTIEKIIQRMVAKHREVWSKISIEPEIAQKYSHHQLVTLASIVEREATLFREQPHISGVFHNRLRLGYPLGADPTVRFAIKKFGGPLRVSELNTNSPYNTRKFPGLPPGPICSPGKGALEAAGNPLATKDLYFVAKWDGSGEHDFSVTNAEHERKKISIRRKNDLRIKRNAVRAH